MKYGHNSFDASFSSVWTRHGLESSLRLFSLQACHGAKNLIRPTTVPCCESPFPPRTSIQRFTGYHNNHNTKRMCVMVISERVSLLMRVCRSLDKARAGLSDLTSQPPQRFLPRQSFARPLLGWHKAHAWVTTVFSCNCKVGLWVWIQKQEI